MTLKNLGQKGVIGQFIPLIILLAGILVGLYLIKHPQIFKGKAGGGNVQWIVPQSPDPQNCVTVKDNNYVITCPNAKFKILVPEEVSSSQ